MPPPSTGGTDTDRAADVTAILGADVGRVDVRTHDVDDRLRDL